MAEFAPGSLFGSYEIEGVLGRGGMGTVYRARSLKLDRLVALKVIGSSSAHDPKFRERFRREALAAASIEHPHVVPVYDADEYEGCLFLATRLIDGTDLRAVLAREGPLPAGVAARLVGQIASALDVAHARGVVHRDVKPPNVLIEGGRGSEHAYLTDFGIAKRTGAEESLTRTGVLIGTLDYVAPEALRGGVVGPPADVYALGCVLYELLSGEVPFVRESDAAKITAVLFDPPPSVCERVRGLPDGLDDTVRRALAKDPGERFRSAGELARDAAIALTGAVGFAVTSAEPAATVTITGGASPRATLEDAIPRDDQSLRSPRPGGDVAWITERAAAPPPAPKAPAPSEESGARDVDSHLRDRSAPVSKRKVVTALFCDVAGSTSLGEELDPEVLHGAMNRCFRELRTTIERHGGTIEKFIGDAVMAVFGVPRVHEDDALRAVRAAAEIRERLPAVAAEVGVTLSFRIALNTGVVLSGEGETLAIGDAVNVAARLKQAAEFGEIVLGEMTLRLVRNAVEVEPLEPITAEGKSEPVRAFRLLAVDVLAPGIARHLEVPLVGRKRELGVLRGAWDRTVEESGCHLFTLLGAAGVGKSRLVSELLANVSDVAMVLQGRCLHYGEGITFWPLLEALASVGERADAVIEHLRGGGAATPQELFWEVRRLLESLAQERPLILHVDDLQWAEAMLLDLIDHVVDHSRGAPILLLCSARPELLDERRGWGGGKLNAATVLLEPLAAADCEALLDQLGNGLGPSERARVLEASEGNPLFLEEMVALARESGEIAVPPSIEALLSARLEQLPIGERELLTCGAVEGEVFHRQAVGTLAGYKTETAVERPIASLVRKDLIRSHRSTLPGDEAFRFRHLLIRDAAYESLPKATRADFHTRFAGWLERNARDLAELDEICGWHLEKVVRYQRELSRKIDPALATRAAAHLQAAGRRASNRADVSAATNLLERALSLAPERSTLRAAVCVDLADALSDTDLVRADELLAVAESDPRISDLPALTRFEWMIHAQPREATAAIEARLPGILERLTEAGDARNLAKAHMVAAQVHWLALRATAAGEELRLVAHYAGEAGDGVLRSRALAQYIATLTYGRADAATLARELAAIETDNPGPYLTAFLDLGHSELARLDGNFDDARVFAHRAIDGLKSLGMGTFQGGLEQDLGQIELSARDPAAALAALLRSDAILVKLGERAYRSTTQALLADAHERLGNRHAAQAAIALSDQLTAAEDLVNDVVTHAVRARLALADGENTVAESCARRAVECAQHTDFIRLTAYARLNLGRVLLALGRPKEAVDEARAAMELYEAKGDRPGVAEAAELLNSPPLRRV